MMLITNPGRSIRYEEATANLHGMIPKHTKQGQCDRGRNAAPALGWFRGHTAGVYDVVLFLRSQGHSRIANKVMRSFGLEEAAEAEGGEQ